jgi:hypothetical protein
VTVTLTGASNTVAPIAVGLNPFVSPMAAPAVGVIDTPVDGATGITGSIAVTGWALDDVEVVSVGIYRDPVPPEPADGLVFVGNAVFVDGARLDLLGCVPPHAAQHPGRAGATCCSRTCSPTRATAPSASTRSRPTARGTRPCSRTRRRSRVDNASSSAPFGAIDTPQQGETVSGTVNNFGWVLVRDGARVGRPRRRVRRRSTSTACRSACPAGWTGRSDITQAFPTGCADLSSTAAVHSLRQHGAHQRRAHDRLGRCARRTASQAGVGSRYFTVSNGVVGSIEGAAQPGGASMTVVAPASAGLPIDDAQVLALAPAASVAGRRGFDPGARYRTYRQGRDGAIVVPAEELDRVELMLDGGEGGLRDTTYAGYLRTSGALGPLPIGANLDPRTGAFTWQPGVGFVGAYDFVLVRVIGGEARARYDVRIVLHPKSSGRVGPQIVIDTPSARQDVEQPFVVAGWAVDLDADTGTGVDAVHVWAYPVTGEPPIFLGPATYGGRRSDVGAVLSDRFEGSGYGLAVQGLEPGQYDLAVFAWSTVTQDFVPARTVRITVR